MCLTGITFYIILKGLKSYRGKREGWMGGRRFWGGRRRTTQPTSASVESSCVTFLNYWKPCVYPYSKCGNISLKLLSHWHPEQPLQCWANSVRMVPVEHDCLLDGLSFSCLPFCLCISTMSIFIALLPQVQPLSEPFCDN
jgi:hypothetical protein